MTGFQFRRVAPKFPPFEALLLSEVVAFPEIAPSAVLAFLGYGLSDRNGIILVAKRFVFSANHPSSPALTLGMSNL